MLTTGQSSQSVHRYSFHFFFFFLTFCKLEIFKIKLIKIWEKTAMPVIAVIEEAEWGLQVWSQSQQVREDLTTIETVSLNKQTKG